MKIVFLPNLPSKGDISDFLDAHGDEAGKQALLSLLERTPTWTPAAEDRQEAPQATKKPERGETGGDTGGKETKRDKLLVAHDVFTDSGASVFLDDENAPWARVPRNGGHEVMQADAEPFRRWMLRKFVATEGAGLADQTISMLIRYVAALADDRPRKKLWPRFFSTPEKITIDLCNSDWECVEIDRNGWRVNRPEVPIFRRYDHMTPLPHPKKGGSMDGLMDLLSISEDYVRTLIRVWICTTALTHLPRPILVLNGPAGSAKSTRMELIRSATDPSEDSRIQFPDEDKKEVGQILYQHAVPSIDDLELLPLSISKLIGVACTGGSIPKRSLYTNDGTTTFRLRRAIILNGLNVPVTAPDFVQRCIFATMPLIREENRREETEVKVAAAKLAAETFGAVCDALAAAFSIREKLKPSRKPRMADWQSWACAVGEAMGLGGEKEGAGARLVEEAYWQAVDDQSSAVKEANPMAGAVIKLVESSLNKIWEGKSTELLREINKLVEEEARGKHWPKSREWAGRRLREVETILATDRIFVDVSSDRTIRIEKIPFLPSLPCADDVNTPNDKINSDTVNDHSKPEDACEIPLPCEDMNGKADSNDSKGVTVSLLSNLCAPPGANQNSKNSKNGISGKVDEKITGEREDDIPSLPVSSLDSPWDDGPPVRTPEQDEYFQRAALARQGGAIQRCALCPSCDYGACLLSGRDIDDTLVCPQEGSA